MIKSEVVYFSAVILTHVLPHLDQMHQNLWDAVKAVLTGKWLMLT